MCWSFWVILIYKHTDNLSNIDIYSCDIMVIDKKKNELDE